jgi:uncharacterized Ntn-hydrolase superfamily protein
MTFSIVAIDKENKEVGFAIASCAWNAGLVCRAETDIGAIASQAQGRLLFLKVFFEQLKEKKTNKEILEHFKEIDENIENRQIGLITFDDEPISFTGDKCSYWAGHKTGKNFACQGNILVGPEVIEEMATAFEKTKGSLTDKLYAALKAGDDAGGDARGKQSAKLLVKKVKGGLSGDDFVTNITIEDNDEPVKEIGRILEVRSNLVKIYQFSVELGEANNDDEKLAILDKAAKFLEDKKEPRYIDYWATLAFGFMELNQLEKAAYYFKIMLKISPKYKRSFIESAKKNDYPEEIVKIFTDD